MKFIVVDDERLILEFMVKTIHEAESSAEITSFQSAEKAVECVKNNKFDVAFLDIQINSTSGIQLAKEIKKYNPKINIIFCTGYSEYQKDAFHVHASGYLMKPVTVEDVREELDNLLYPIKKTEDTKVRLQCFGNFEIFVDGKPVVFKMEKTKEVLAYLVDRRCTLVKNSEIITALWEDDKNHRSYFQNLQSDLKNTLKEVGCEDIISSSWGKLGIIRSKVSCDYYDWLDGEVNGINAYQGQYMAQYSWSELTNGVLFE